MLALVGALAACGDGVAPDRRFGEDAVELYLEVALGAEFGDALPVVRKWTQDLLVRLEGLPAAADVAELDRVIGELNELRSGPRVRLADPGEPSNITLHFAPESTFAEILPEYVPVNRGFFWFWSNGRQEITSAVILIDNTDAITQAFRDHLVREELTQVLGLANDSPRFPGSIFHQGTFPAPTSYSDLDREVIRIHDLPEIRPGMTENEVRGVLRH